MLQNYDVLIPSQKIMFESVDSELRQKFENSVVRTVNISGNSYSKQFCEDLGKLLVSQDQIDALNFNDIFVSRKKDEIPQAMTSLLSIELLSKNLQKLDLSNNAVSTNGAEAIAPFLSQANTLKVLLINNCGLGIIGSTTLCQALKVGTPNLEIWSMARNRIEDAGASQVGAAVQTMKNLKQLVIFQNFIRADGMHQVLQGLISCEQLEVLDINDNYVKDESADLLATLLEKAQNLRILNVSDCNMTQKENEIFISALEKNPKKFEKLGYNYNDLGDDLGKQLLTLVIKDNQNLTRFDIKGNEITKKATKKFFQDQIEQSGLNANLLSAFESDSDEEQDLVKQFSDLQL